MSVDYGKKWIAVEWSDRRADYYYVLREEVFITPSIETWESTGFLGLGPMKRVESHERATKHTSDVATGDLAWARKIAKRYGLEVPHKESRS